MMRAIGLMIVTAGLAVVSTIGRADAPYAGFDNRQIKALSPQQVEDVKAGKGMGMALPAEVNGYPGPAHVLELAEGLSLTDEQRSRTTALFNDMKQEAQAAGESYLESEAQLESLFTTGAADAESLRDAVMRTGDHQAALRFVHLKYHLAMLDVLTPQQIARYRALRGYGGTTLTQPGTPRHQHQ